MLIALISADIELLLKLVDVVFVGKGLILLADHLIHSGICILAGFLELNVICFSYRCGYAFEKDGLIFCRVIGFFKLMNLCQKTSIVFSKVFNGWPLLCNSWRLTLEFVFHDFWDGIGCFYQMKVLLVLSIHWYAIFEYLIHNIGWITQFMPLIIVKVFKPRRFCKQILRFIIIFKLFIGQLHQVLTIRFFL